MKLRGLLDEDFVQYKEPSMFLIFPNCTFKCDKERGTNVCQNSGLVRETYIVDIPVKKLVDRYLSDPITGAIVCGGLEPLDSFDDLLELLTELRKHCDHTVVIYTGYRNDEVENKIEQLSKFSNVIVKFGRFIPGQERHFDPVLGVNLRSLNQYRVKIS